MTNACKDVWLVAIKVLQDGKNKSQKATKKRKKIRMILFAAIHWMQNEMWARLKTHKSWCVQQFNFFFKFYVVNTCSKFGSWFQTLHYSKI
jgi:hypothetical protein